MNFGAKPPTGPYVKFLDELDENFEDMLLKISPTMFDNFKDINDFNDYHSNVHDYVLEILYLLEKYKNKLNDEKISKYFDEIKTLNENFTKEYKKINELFLTKNRNAFTNVNNKYYDGEYNDIYEEARERLGCGNNGFGYGFGGSMYMSACEKLRKYCTHTNPHSDIILINFIRVFVDILRDEDKYKYNDLIVRLEKLKGKFEKEFENENKKINKDKVLLSKFKKLFNNYIHSFINFYGKLYEYVERETRKSNFGAHGNGFGAHGNGFGVKSSKYQVMYDKMMNNPYKIDPTEFTLENMEGCEGLYIRIRHYINNVTGVLNNNNYPEDKEITKFGKQFETLYKNIKINYNDIYKQYQQKLDNYQQKLDEEYYHPFLDFYENVLEMAGCKTKKSKFGGPVVNELCDTLLSDDYLPGPVFKPGNGSIFLHVNDVKDLVQEIEDEEYDSNYDNILDYIDEVTEGDNGFIHQYSIKLGEFEETLSTHPNIITPFRKMLDRYYQGIIDKRDEILEYLNSKIHDTNGFGKKRRPLPNVGPVKSGSRSVGYAFYSKTGYGYSRVYEITRGTKKVKIDRFGKIVKFKVYRTKGEAEKESKRRFKALKKKGKVKGARQKFIP